MSGFASQIPSMALLGSGFTSEVGLRVLLSPLGSNIVLRTACCSIGIGLPVYSTFKAIENRDQSAQRKWLIYWAAYGSFSLVEVFTDKLISWYYWTSQNDITGNGTAPPPSGRQEETPNISPEPEPSTATIRDLEESESDHED
ncbi:HVA22-like protein k isoform X2 [Brassica napus]|uniref:HVA22-like protein k isoform X2 n=1 Tax=Brassica napus TaxID=3708 RepID=UPI0020785DEE|nr:HVA22-like protein k isoform X2 [Brassica napus]